MRKGLVLLKLGVAIIALIAAVAVPYYKTYVIRAKTYAAMKIFKDWADQAAHFAIMYGYFPYSTDLKMPTNDAGSGRQQNIDYSYLSTVAPYFNNSSAPGAGFGLVGDTCGKSGYVGGSLNPQAFGFSSEYNSFGVSLNYYNVNSIIQFACFYWLSTPAGNVTSEDQYFGCQNKYGTNSTIEAQLNTLASQAVCM